MRIYDPRIGKFLSVDPLTRSYPWYTPYQFAGNSPIANVDLDGLEEARSTSAAIGAGAQQYADEKKAQSRGIFKTLFSGETRRSITSYAKDWGRAVTGDRAAIHRVNVKTTGAITQSSMALANSITEPGVFFSTMHNRSKYENIQGSTYYGLKLLEGYGIWRFSEGMADDGFQIGRNGEEVLPSATRGVAFGKDIGTRLADFSNKIDAAYFRNWHNKLDVKYGLSFAEQFEQVTAKVIRGGGRIHFELADVSITGARRITGSFEEAAKRGRATEWELNKILNNEQLRGHTDFYLNGKKQTAEQLKKMGIQ